MEQTRTGPAPAGAMRASNTAAVRERPADRAWREGVAAADDARWDDAVRAFERAVAADGSDAVLRLNLAHALSRRDEHARAFEEARRALALDPSLELAGRLMVQALGAARDTVAMQALLDGDGIPATLAPELLSTQAHRLLEAGRAQDAALAALRALGLKMDHADAHLALGFALGRLGMPAEAAESMRTAAALLPDDALVASGALHAAAKAGDWRDADGHMRTIRRALARPDGEGINPFMATGLPLSSAELLESTRRYARRHWAGIRPLPARAARAAPDGRIRIGYLSNDFQVHATAHLFARVLELHDRDRFHVTLYSHGPADGSAMRRRLIDGADAFVDILDLGDEAAARRIRDDGIDVLVDLKGYTFGARPGIAARRPAPVQAAWLGFPGTMGMPCFDYVIADPVVIPPGDEVHYTEKVARLPFTYQPTDDTRLVDEPPPRAAVGLPDDAFVFCCFNVPWKLSPATFATWSRILAGAPGSVLWLMDGGGPVVRDNLLRMAAGAGIDPARVVFAAPMEQTRHLGRLRLADLVLDTLPYNAHTTASDALWAGVPVLTRIGETFAGRVAASLLHAAGLPELVVDTEQAYVDTAVALASRPAGWSAWRAGLRDRVRATPLFDSAGFARALDHLMQRMHERAVAGLPSVHLDSLPSVAHGPSSRDGTHR